MAALMRGIIEGYHSTVTENIDPRSADWVMASSLLVPLSIVAVYLLVVKWLGPRFMADREPLKIEPIIIVYNALQIVACAHTMLTGIYLCFIRMRYNLLCQPVDPEINEDTTMAANLVFTYYMIKISDLLDTVFFVLRKKHGHVSFLHVYHHAGMVVVGFLACKFSLNGHFVLLGIVNSFVHVVMYTYYLATALFPDRKPGIRVKKALTLIQLAQFCVLLVHEALPLFQPSCRVQKFWCFALVVQYSFMITLFSDFYVKAYASPTKSKPS